MISIKPVKKKRFPEGIWRKLAHISSYASVSECDAKTKCTATLNTKINNIFISGWLQIEKLGFDNNIIVMSL